MTPWYNEASGGKQPLKFDFKIRFGSLWYKYKALYMQALMDRARELQQKGNVKGAKLIKLHLDTLPPTLPYEINVTGFEWPVVASCLLGTVAKTSDPELRKQYTTLYQKCVKARTEAGYDSKYGGGPID